MNHEQSSLAPGDPPSALALAMRRWRPWHPHLEDLGERNGVWLQKPSINGDILGILHGLSWENGMTIFLYFGMTIFYVSKLRTCTPT